jgi:hypothetical protein
MIRCGVGFELDMEFAFGTATNTSMARGNSWWALKNLWRSLSCYGRRCERKLSVLYGSLTS